MRARIGGRAFAPLDCHSLVTLFEQIYFRGVALIFRGGSLKEGLDSSFIRFVGMYEAHDFTGNFIWSFLFFIHSLKFTCMK